MFTEIIIIISVFDPITIESIKQDKAFQKTTKKQQKEYDTLKKKQAKEKLAVQKTQCSAIDKLIKGKKYVNINTFAHSFFVIYFSNNIILKMLIGDFTSLSHIVDKSRKPDDQNIKNSNMGLFTARLSREGGS